jgi:succinate dehydrogenase (ubiquinone) iron-sulfur subunit
VNTLACLSRIDRGGKDAKIYPLPHSTSLSQLIGSSVRSLTENAVFIVKDLVPDMTQFYKQYKSIEPFLKNDNPPEKGIYKIASYYVVRQS